jgi:hypothetical protein
MFQSFLMIISYLGTNQGLYITEKSIRRFLSGSK